MLVRPAEIKMQKSKCSVVACLGQQVLQLSARTCTVPANRLSASLKRELGCAPLAGHVGAAMFGTATADEWSGGCLQGIMLVV
jgi:hypothetical protein